MATIADLEIIVTANTADAESGLSNVNNKLDSNVIKQGAVGAGMMGLSKMGMDFFGGAIMSAVDFEAQIIDLGIALGITGGELDSMQGWVMDMGAAFPFSAESVAQLATELGKLGFSVEDVKMLAEQVMYLSTAIGGDLVGNGEAVAKIINSLGLEAEDAKWLVQDLFAVLQVGSLDLDSFMEAWKNMGAAVKSAGLSFLEAAAFLTILADAGIAPQTAGMALARLFTALINPTDKLKKMFNDLGIQWWDTANNKMLPVKDIIFKIMEAWSGLTEAEKWDLAELIGGKEYADELVTLFDKGTAAFDAFMEKIRNVPSLMDVAKQKMSSAKQGFDTFLETIQNLQIVIGQQLLPAFKSVIKFITPLVDKIAALPRPILKVIAIGGALATVFVGIAGAIGVLMASGALGVMATAFGLLVSPVMLVIAALAALGVGLYLLYQRFEGFRNVVNSVIGFVYTLGSAITNGVVTAFNTATSAVKALWDIFTTIFGGGIAAAFDEIKSSVESIVQPFTDFKDALVAAFDGDWSEMFSKLGEAAVSSVEALVELYTAVPETIAAFFANVDWALMWEGLKSVASTVWDGIAGVATGIWDSITTFFSSVDWGAIWSGLLDIASTIWGGLTGIASTAWSGVTGFFSGIDWSALWSALGDTASLAWDVISVVAEVAWGKVTNFFSGINWSGLWSGLKSAAVTAWDSLKGIAETAWGKVTGFFSGVNWGSIWNSMKLAAKVAWNELKDFASDAWDDIKGVFDGVTWSSIWDGMTNAARTAWTAVIDEVIVLVNSFIDKLNGAIQKMNDFLPKDIPLIPKIGSDSESAQKQVDSLVGSLGELATNGLTNGLGFLQVAKDAKIAEDRVRASRGELEAINNLMTNMIVPANSKGRDQGDIGSPYSDPYRPTEGGGTGVENQGVPIGSGASGVFGEIVTGAKNAQIALTSFNTTQAATGSQSVVSFGQIKTSADSSILPLATQTANTSGSMATSWLNNMNRMAFGNSSSWTDVSVTTTTQTASARNSAVANVSAMATTIGARMSNISAVTRSQMTAATLGAIAQMTAMQAGTASRMAAMATTVGSKMSNIASTTRSQMSNANSSVSTQLAAMSLGTSVKMALMATTANTKLGLMVSSTRTQTASMAAAMAGGMASTAAQILVGSARWAGIISSAGAGAANTARSVGFNIGAGVASGLYAALGSVTAAANAIIAQVDRAMRAKAQIHSPSRMTAYLGQMMGEGLAVGMTDMIRDVSKAGIALSEAAIHEPVALLPNVSASAVSGQGSSQGSGTTYNQQTYNVTVSVSDLDEFKDAADFFSSLDRERQLAFTE